MRRLLRALCVVVAGVAACNLAAPLQARDPAPPGYPAGKVVYSTAGSALVVGRNFIWFADANSRNRRIYCPTRLERRRLNRLLERLHQLPDLVRGRPYMARGGQSLYTRDGRRKQLVEGDSRYRRRLPVAARALIAEMHRLRATEYAGSRRLSNRSSIDPRRLARFCE